MRRSLFILGRGLAALVPVLLGTAGAWGVGGCGSATGGSEAGNPSRSVVGALVTTSSSSLALLATDQPAAASSQSSCPADKVVAVDSRKQENSVPVASDCSFELELAFNKAYSIRFRLGDVDVGSMIFQNSPERFPSPVMEIAEEPIGISLGLIEIDDGQSMPENEPAAQNDADLDGVPDLEDVDDDNDGILDVDEPDCDLDGIIDDFDDNNKNCPLVSTLPDNTVLEVLPRNGSGIVTPEDAVLLDRIAIQARFSCELDPGSLSAETFVVTSKDGTDSVLECDLSIADEGTTASCEPAGLAADTKYQATIRSIRCMDGKAIGTTTWEWRTAPVASSLVEVTPPIEAEKIPE